MTHREEFLRTFPKKGRLDADRLGRLVCRGDNDEFYALLILMRHGELAAARRGWIRNTFILLVTAAILFAAVWVTGTATARQESSHLIADAQHRAEEIIAEASKPGTPQYVVDQLNREKLTIEYGEMKTPKTGVPFKGFYIKAENPIWGATVSEKEIFIGIRDLSYMPPLTE